MRVLIPKIRAVRHQDGFTYLAVLVTVIVAGIALAGTGLHWRTVMKREREAQLLFYGDRIRQAVRSYVESGSGEYPQRLEDLIRDPRVPGVRRHLRKIWPDPVTPDGQWEVIRREDGGISGVHSRSVEKPLKTGNFPSGYEKFETAHSYSEWKFVWQPNG